MPRYGVAMAVVPVYQGLDVLRAQYQGSVQVDGFAAVGLGVVPDADGLMCWVQWL